MKLTDQDYQVLEVTCAAALKSQGGMIDQESLVAELPDLTADQLAESIEILRDQRMVEAPASMGSKLPPYVRANRRGLLSYLGKSRPSLRDDLMLVGESVLSGAMTNLDIARATSLELPYVDFLLQELQHRRGLELSTGAAGGFRRVTKVTLLKRLLAET